ncbi:hypothetical protein ACLOJK_037239 [Asimina triloba]
MRLLGTGAVRIWEEGWVAVATAPCLTIGDEDDGSKWACLAIGPCWARLAQLEPKRELQRQLTFLLPLAERPFAQFDACLMFFPFMGSSPFYRHDLCLFIVVRLREH